MAEDTITNSTVDSNEGIYKSDYQVQNGQKQFPGIAGNNVISYPLWSKRSVRRRHEQVQFYFYNIILWYKLLNKNGRLIKAAVLFENFK